MKFRIVVECDVETRSSAVYCPELLVCCSTGDTEEEALANAKEAISLYLEPSGYHADSHSARPEVDLDGADNCQSFGVDYSDIIAGGMADERT